MTTAAVTENNSPAFNIQRVYLKGVSLEPARIPAMFLEQGELQMEFSLATTIGQLAPTIFEVVLRGTLTAKKGAVTDFLLEVDQSGIFELVNIPADQLAAALEINGPTILAPYLRSNIADILQRATLPAFVMPEINWVAAFTEKQKAMQQQAAAPALVH